MVADRSTVPRVEDLFAPTIRALQQLGGTARIADIEREVAIDLALSDHILKVPHANDARTEFEYRNAWARTRLKRDGLLTNPRRGTWSLSEAIQNPSEDEITRLSQRVSTGQYDAEPADDSRELDETTPEAPLQGHGPKFLATSEGFEIETEAPSVAERNDPTQRILHQQLLDRIERLKSLTQRIANTHPILLSEFTVYAELASQSMDRIDIASLWVVGNAFQNTLEAVSRAPSGVMTEPLEPELLGQFNTLAALHAAFILGFVEGKELTSRAQALASSNIDITVASQQTSDVLKPMLDSSGLLTKQAHKVINALNKALEFTNYKTALLAQAAIDTTTNGLIAFSRVLVPLIFLKEAVDVGMKAVGDPNWEAVNIALKFLVENRAAIGAFAAYNPELKLWLDWAIERAHTRRNERT